MKKVLVISDLTCHGEVNMIPTVQVLSAFDVQVSVLPTSITSTVDTFSNKIIVDLTEEMEKIINHFKEERIKFDCIYVGYVSKREQFNHIVEAKERLLEDEGIFVVDPKLGRNGKLYEELDEGIIMGMMDITSISDYTLPNITEAMLLTNNRKYEDIQDDYYINELIADLYRNGCKNVILTSVQDDAYSSGAIAYDGLTKTTVLKEKMEGEYKGVGDIFKAFVVGSILSGKNIKEAMDMASEFVMDALDYTIEDDKHQYAIKFEESLAKYTHIKPNPGWE